MTTFTRTPGQDGAALITSLIFLTVLTVLGMSSMGTALLESRMAGNSRDRNLAFQAAELGLRDAESFIRDSGRIAGNVMLESQPSAGDGDYAAISCAKGFCYNGPDWNKSGVDWIANPAFENETYWANALQYQRNDATTKKGVGKAGVALAIKPAYVLPAALPLVSAQPEYLIESLPQKIGSDKSFYRIAVRGYGMRSGTRVILQEVFTP